MFRLVVPVFSFDEVVLPWTFPKRCNISVGFWFCVKAAFSSRNWCSCCEPWQNKIFCVDVSVSYHPAQNLDSAPELNMNGGAAGLFCLAIQNFRSLSLHFVGHGRKFTDSLHTIMCCNHVRRWHKIQAFLCLLYSYRLSSFMKLKERKRVLLERTLTSKSYCYILLVDKSNLKSSVTLYLSAKSLSAPGQLKKVRDILESHD